MKQSSYYYIDKKKAYVKKVSPEKKKKGVLLKNEIIEDTRREIIPLLLLLVLGLLLFGLLRLATSKLGHPATIIVQEKQKTEPALEDKTEQAEEVPVSESPVEPVISAEKEPKPKEKKLSKIDYMDKSRVMTRGVATSIRNKEYTNALISYREGYVVYCLNKEYDELRAVFCVEYGSTLDTEVSIEFAAVEEGQEYSLPINCDSTSSYRLYTNGYDYPKEFTVDLRDVDILKIYMYPHYSGLSYGGDDASIIIADPLLISY